MRILLPMKLNETKKTKQNTQEKNKYKTSKAVYMEVFIDYIKSQCKVTWLIFVVTFFSPHLFAPPDSPLLKIPSLLPWSWCVSGWDLRSSGGMWSRWGDIPCRIFTKKSKKSAKWWTCCACSADLTQSFLSLHGTRVHILGRDYEFFWACFLFSFVIEYFWSLVIFFKDRNQTK